MNCAKDDDNDVFLKVQHGTNHVSSSSSLQKYELELNQISSIMDYQSIDSDLDCVIDTDWSEDDVFLNNESLLMKRLKT